MRRGRSTWVAGADPGLRRAPACCAAHHRHPVKIQEADAKKLLLAQGLPVPPWEVARSPTEARAAASRLLHGAGHASQVVIKAQVLVGGRGKAGGVKLASSDDEAEHVADAILGMQIKGHHGPEGARGAGRRHREGVLPRGGPRPGSPEDPADGLRRGRRRDRAGGRRQPRCDRSGPRDPVLGLRDWWARELAFRLGLGAHLKAAVGIAKGLVRTMLANDADLVEINLLAVVRGGGPGGAEEQLVCLDEDHPRRSGAVPAPRSRGAARPRRGGTRRRRGLTPRHQLHPPRRHHRLHGQRRRPRDDHDGPREARRR